MTYNVLITGAGSVMGQSIYKALSKSHHAIEINLFVTNSVELGAAFQFSGESLCCFKSQKNIVCPLARNPEYLSFIDQLICKYKIDIVYPGTQHELLALSSFSKWRDIIACPNIETVENCLDKASTTEVLESIGISGPDTVRVVNGVLERSVDFPAILKPNSSSASRNIFKCDNSSELDKALIEYSSLGIKSAVVQSYLSGPEMTCGLYLDRYSSIASSIIFERELSEDGASLYGQVVENSNISQYLDRVIKAFVEKSKFKFGHLNIQLRLTNNGPFLFEINGRLSSTEAPKAHLGFNSVEAYFYNVVLKKPYVNFSPNVGKKFIRYYEEIYF